jgi:hypothetical protein
MTFIRNYCKGRKMSSVIITNSASEVIGHRRNEAAFPSPTSLRRIPLLAWSERSYFDDSTGHRTEFRPQFYFSWTNDEEIIDNEYFTTETDHGGRLALAPGELFRSGSHKIDLKDGKLTLKSSE